MEEARVLQKRLIVVDPRITETAHFAELHLRPIPGADPVLLAGIIKVILDRSLYDADFCTDHVRGLEVLGGAVAPFVLDVVSRRTGVDAVDIVRAAELLTSTRMGGATAGTGPNMSGYGPLTEYLLLCIYDLCGYWRRAGDVVSNPPVLAPQRAWKAQSTGPSKGWGFGQRLRGAGVNQNTAGMPTAALPDEILLDAPDRVRAVICAGGNPAVAWPDQLNTVRALEHLDLLVCLDVAHTTTTRFAHYLVGTKLSFEVPGVSVRSFMARSGPENSGYGSPYAQYTPAITDPPPGADVVEEWEWFFGLAQRLGLQLEVAGEQLDMHTTITSDEMLDLIFRRALVPLDEVRRHPHGKEFWNVATVVQPADQSRRFNVADDEMMRQLAALGTEHVVCASNEFPFLLIVRRVIHVHNSSGRGLKSIARHNEGNPAYLHPRDIADLGIDDGQVVAIRSARAAIPAVVRAAEDVLPGTISMAHAFGGVPADDAFVRTHGSSTSRLVDISQIDPVSGIPRMSAIPVQVIVSSDTATSPNR